MPRPIVIALVVLAAFVALPTVWTELLGFLIGDGSELGFLFRLGLLVAVIAGLSWLVGRSKGNSASLASFLASLRTAITAVAKALPPLARATAGGTRQPFNTLKSAVTYLWGFRWPTALIWFLLTFGIFIVQTQPDIGFILMFLGAPFWSVATINLGFAQLIVEPAVRRISPAWSLVGLSWFVGYAAVSIHGHIALDRLAAEIETENSRQSLPFDPRTRSLVVHGVFDDALSAEHVLRTYPLSVVYEEHEDAGDGIKPAPVRAGRPRFTARRLGPPELCDSIASDARLKAAVTFYVTIPIGRASFCRYTTMEAPDLPVVRVRFAREKLRIVGANGIIERITLTSGGDTREVASLRAAPYQYLPMPLIGCFWNGGPDWTCEHRFLTESYRTYSDNHALVGQSLGLAPASGASRSGQILAAGAAPLERARDLGEASAAVELDRLLAHPVGSTAQLDLHVLSARPDLIASRAERLADAAAIALTTRQNGGDSQIWDDLMLALSHADFARVGPRFVDAVLARLTDASGRHDAALGERLTRRLVDLGPTAQPLLERIRHEGRFR